MMARGIRFYNNSNSYLFEKDINQDLYIYTSTMNEKTTTAYFSLLNGVSI